jgi:hypothetical protein
LIGRFGLAANVVSVVVRHAHPVLLQIAYIYQNRRINRRPERIAIGRFPDMAIQRARSEAQKLQGQIADGKNPAEDRRAAHGALET